MNRLGHVALELKEAKEDVARLTNKLSEYVHQIKDYQFELEKVNHEKDKEIEILKNKLKERQKVVYCKDCANTYCTKITLADKCKVWGHQPSPNGYCNRGRRRKN